MGDDGREWNGRGKKAFDPLGEESPNCSSPCSSLSKGQDAAHPIVPEEEAGQPTGAARLYIDLRQEPRSSDSGLGPADANKPCTLDRFQVC